MLIVVLCIVIWSCDLGSNHMHASKFGGMLQHLLYPCFLCPWIRYLFICWSSLFNRDTVHLNFNLTLPCSMLVCCPLIFACYLWVAHLSFYTWLRWYTKCTRTMCACACVHIRHGAKCIWKYLSKVQVLWNFMKYKYK